MYDNIYKSLALSRNSLESSDAIEEESECRRVDWKRFVVEANCFGGCNLSQNEKHLAVCLINSSTVSRYARMHKFQR